jgi:TPR repeat protein
MVVDDLYNSAIKSGSHDTIFKAAIDYEKKFRETRYKRHLHYAEKLYRKLVNTNNPVIQYKIGYTYQKGLTQEKDYAKAFLWYNKAAEQGLAVAEYKVALFYRYGFVKDMDLGKTAIQYYKELDIDNDPVKYNQLSYNQRMKASLNYFFGSYTSMFKAIKDDGQMAIDYFIRASQKGYAPAAYELAICYASGTIVEMNVIKSADLREFTSENGFTGTKHRVIISQYADKITSIDKQLLMNWYEEFDPAYKKVVNEIEFIPDYQFSNVDKQSNIETTIGGDLDYDSDANTDISDDSSFFNDSKFGYGNGYQTQQQLKSHTNKWTQINDKHLFENEKNDPELQYQIGMYHFNGDGVDTKMSKALEFFKKAADQGHAKSMLAIADFYFLIIHDNEEEEKRNEIKVFKWTKRAALKNSPEAQFKMGEFYRGGYAVKRNETKALKWYKLSAENDYADAQHALGRYYTRKSFEQNVSSIENDNNSSNHYSILAFKWFEKAAKQGLKVSQHRLSVLYEKGIGVEKDMEKSREWKERANANRKIL